MTGTTFVRCAQCRVGVELIDDVCPNCGGDPNPKPVAQVVALHPFASLETEEIGEHVIFANEVYCAHCGTHVAYCHTTRCGKV